MAPDPAGAGPAAAGRTGALALWARPLHIKLVNLV